LRLAQGDAEGVVDRGGDFLGADGVGMDVGGMFVASAPLSQNSYFRCIAKE